MTGEGNRAVITQHHDHMNSRDITVTAQDYAEDARNHFFGGVRLAQTFARFGLIDEYRFKLESVVVGSGSPLFKDMKDRMKLKLVKSKVFAGVVALYYEPVRK